MLSSGTIFLSLILHFVINKKTRNDTMWFSVNPALYCRYQKVESNPTQVKCLQLCGYLLVIKIIIKLQFELIGDCVIVITRNQLPLIIMFTTSPQK